MNQWQNEYDKNHETYNESKLHFVLHKIDFYREKLRQAIYASNSNL